MSGAARTPVQLATGVWRIPTLGASLINSFAFENADGTLGLVDAGLKGAPKRLVASLGSIGKRPEDVKTIVLTHAHPDHQGGASRLRARTGGQLHVHADDAEFVRSGRRPAMDPPRPLGRVLNFGLFRRQPACEVDGTFGDGELLEIGGGLRVLHTPGHSPGHCSYLHEKSGVLVTGDALFNWRDKMSYPFSILCSNYELSLETADRLGEVDYEIAAFTHGPEIRTDARAAVRSFLRRRRAAR
jgi:glyoxylase-like metal-dependent hydrolase (beta-lactamase superfamily II)